MKEPTDAQVKVVWKWCGCYQSTTQLQTGWWHYPDGEIQHGLPPIDLNNLWEYVIPQLCKEYRNWRSVLHDWIDQCTGDYGKDTLLLFAQTYGIIKEKEQVSANRDIQESKATLE